MWGLPREVSVGAEAGRVWPACALVAHTARGLQLNPSSGLPGSLGRAALGPVKTWWVCVHGSCYCVVSGVRGKSVFILFCLYSFLKAHECQAGRPGSRASRASVGLASLHPCNLPGPQGATTSAPLPSQ